MFLSSARFRYCYSHCNSLWQNSTSHVFFPAYSDRHHRANVRGSWFVGLAHLSETDRLVRFAHGQAARFADQSLTTIRLYWFLAHLSGATGSSWCTIWGTD